MGLEQLLFDAWNGEDKVVNLIKEWKPERYRTEKDYEESLYAHLHEHLKEVQVIKQYARGRIRADIVVGDKVLIELKNNLKSTSQFQRMIGQLNEYTKWDGQIILILCGDTEPAMRKEITQFVNNNFEYNGIHVFDKPDPETEESTKESSKWWAWVLIALGVYLFYVGTS